MRIASFVIALLLLAGSVEPTRGWLIALVIVTAIAALRPRFYAPFLLRPALDLRVAALVLAALLLGGAIDPTRSWLSGLSIVTGLAAFMPKLVSLDRDGDWSSFVDIGGWNRRGDDRYGRGWRRWERRFERRARRAGGWEEDWP